jgi:tetratricopeptide (TPR) repeat protein
MIEQRPGSSILPAVISTETALQAVPAPSAEALERARKRAQEIDRSLAGLRASFREAPPTPTDARSTPSHRGASAAILPALTREPAAELRRLLLDGHEAFCRGNFADALAVYEQARHEAPARVAGYLGLARTLLALKRFSDAREAYRQALDLEPDNVAARDGLADSEWRMELPAIELYVPPGRRTAARGPFLRRRRGPN